MVAACCESCPILLVSIIGFVRQVSPFSYFYKFPVRVLLYNSWRMKLWSTDIWSNLFLLTSGLRSGGFTFQNELFLLFPKHTRITFAQSAVDISLGTYISTAWRTWPSNQTTFYRPCSVLSVRANNNISHRYCCASPASLSHWNDTVRRTQVDWKTLPLLLAQGRIRDSRIVCCANVILNSILANSEWNTNWKKMRKLKEKVKPIQRFSLAAIQFEFNFIFKTRNIIV